MLTITEIIGKDKYIRADLLLKAKELQIKGYSTLNVQALIEIIESSVNFPTHVAEIIDLKKRKETIPKVLRNLVWDTYIGQTKGIGNCFSCQKDIDSKFYECGHIISETDGGAISLDNLRPICGLCNKSMGSMNMHVFIGILRAKSDIVNIREIAVNFNFVYYKPLSLSQLLPSHLSPMSYYMPYPSAMSHPDYESNMSYMNFLQGSNSFKDHNIKQLKPPSNDAVTYAYLLNNEIYTTKENLKSGQTTYDLAESSLPSYVCLLDNDIVKIDINKLVMRLVRKKYIVLDETLQRIKCIGEEEIAEQNSGISLGKESKAVVRNIITSKERALQWVDRMSLL